jgi:hypothetical protein
MVYKKVYVIAGLHEVTYLAPLRKKFVSVIVHRVDESEAALVIPRRFAKLAPELPNGMTFVKDAYGMTERLIQPLITSRDIESIASTIIPTFATQPQPGLYQQPTQRFRQTQGLNGQPVIHTTGYTLNAAPKRFNPRLEPSETDKTRLLAGPETRKNTPPSKLNVPNDLRQNIIQLRRQGVARWEIMRRLRLSGEKYKIVQRVLEEEGLQ